jgi:curli production assembly/transport component CsgF
MKFSSESRTMIRGAGSMVAAMLACAAVSPAHGQDLVHQFTNPSFGGNPFNSAHLLGVAAINRPAAPETASQRFGLTEQQLLVRQIQSQLLSSLSQGLVTAITGANPGDSGSFVIGDQRITYSRTLTEIRLTFFNSTTGETTEIILPVINNTPAAAAAAMAAYTAPEALLTSNGGGLVAGGSRTSGGLDSGPVELPLGTLYGPGN